MRVKHILPFGEIFYGRHSGAIGIFVNNIVSKTKDASSYYEIISPHKKWALLARIPVIRRIMRYFYYYKILKNIYSDQVIIVHNDIELVLFLYRNNKKNRIFLHLHNEYDLKLLHICQDLKGIVVCSKYLKNIVLKYNFKVPVHVIENGADFDKNTHDSGEHRNYQLGFIGRLDENKGLHTVLNFFKKSESNIIIIIAKTPISVKSINLFIKLVIFYIGHKGKCEVVYNRSHKFVLDKLSQTKILIVPTQETEAFGMVALEAISCGALVISNAVGGLIDIDIKSGHFFDNGKLDECEVFNLLKNPTRQYKLRVLQHGFAERFSWHSLASKYLNLLKDYKYD